MPQVTYPGKGKARFQAPYPSTQYTSSLYHSNFHTPDIWGKPRWGPERGWDLSKATQRGRGQASGLGLSSSSESGDAGQRQTPARQGKIIGLALSPASPGVEEAMWCHQAKPWGLARGTGQKRGRQCGPSWCLVSRSRQTSA